MVCSIQSRSPNRTYYVRFTPLKPDLSGPKNSFESVISYQQDTNWTLKTEWPSAWDTRRRTRKGEPENAAERGQERHAERTALKIWNYVDTQNQIQ